MELPDEAPTTEGGIRFSAGAMDGILTHSVGASDAQDVAKIVFRQLERVLSRRDGKALNVLHGYLLEHPTLSYVDQINPLLTDAIPSHREGMLALGRHLLRNAADREVVKFAINLVGVCGDEEDHSDLLTIGAHDEFTLFAVVAMSHSGGELPALWEMAKRVTGWGRIQCIERLDREIADPEIRRWLLTEGYKTTIMVEYTAGICARRGELLQALAAPIVDCDVVDGAAEILAALARGAPGEGMAGYKESAPACERFLRLVDAHDSPRVDWLLACRDLERFASAPSSTDARSEDWTQADKDRCVQAAMRARSRPVWATIIEKELKNEDGVRFNIAAEAAQVVGLDPWEQRFARLLAGNDQWYWLLETTDEFRLVRVLGQAELQISLRKVATGYGDELGLGPGYEEHRKLDWVLQALDRWPGHGAAFIIAGFQSPVVRNRWGATRAALRWKPDMRNPLLGAASMLHRVEEDAELKAALGKLLAGGVQEDSSGSVES